MASFADIASKRIADVERPPIPPKGMYRFQISKLPSLDQLNADYEKVSIMCRAVEAYDNVDADDLKAFGGVKNIALPLEFIFDKNDDTKFQQTLFRLRTFLERHAVIEGAEEMTITQALNASINATFDAELTHRADPKDTSVFYAQMGKTAPVRE